MTNTISRVLKGALAGLRRTRSHKTMSAGVAAVGVVAVLSALTINAARSVNAQGVVSYAVASGLPSFRLLQPATTITPAAALGYYGSPSSPASPTASARIKTLARALENNPDRIYQFVRNGIAFEPQFGLHKGGEGVLLDGAGGAFDQAQLMVELLRASGWGARYAMGIVDLGPEAASILKVADARQACVLLASSGTPATVNGQTSCATVSGSIQSVQMLHVWVEAHIQDGWYAFDPSLKQSVRVQGIDVWQAMGANASGAWSNVSSGVSSGQSTVAGLNQGTIDAKLTSYATALQNTLITDHAEKGLKEVAGGWEIQRVEDTQRLASLPGRNVLAHWSGDVPSPYRATLRLHTAGFQHTYDLPSIYAYRIQAQIQGRVLKVAVRKCDHLNGFAGAYFHGGQMSGQAPTQCEIDNTVTGGDDSASFDGRNRNLLMRIDHPYAADNGAFADEETGKRIEIGKRVDILVRTGGGAGTRSSLWANEIDPLMDLKVIEEGNPYECEIYGGPGPDVPITPDTCNGTGAEDWNFWIQDNKRFTKGEVVAAEMKSRKDSLLNFWTETFDLTTGLVEAFSGARVFHQHSLGVALDPSYGGSVMDVDTVVGIATSGGDQPHQILNALATVSAGAEAGAIAQIRSQEYGTGGSALNGMKVLAAAPSLTRLNPGESVATLPVGVDAPVRAEIERYLAKGFSVIVPGQGKGFFARRNDGAEQAWIIGEGSRGVYHKDNVDPRNDFRKGAADAPRPLDFLGKAEQASIAANVAGAQLGSVDLRSGSLSFGAGDEVTVGQGEFPHSLAFTRRYASSGPAGGFGELGAGWTHNWESSAYRKSDFSVLVSQNDPVSAAPTMVAVMLALQGGRSDTIEASVVSGFVMNWWQDQGAGYENLALVNGGGQSGRFVRLANGQWRNPSSPTEELVIGANNSTEHNRFTWTLADRSVQRFIPLSLQPHMPHYGDTSVKGRIALSNWSFPTGVVVSLSYTPSSPTNLPYLTRVENNLGAALNFTFSTNPSQQQQNECLTLAAGMGDAGEQKKQCQLAARAGGRLLSVTNGVTTAGFGYMDDCHINTSYCAYYLVIAAQDGRRNREYQYDVPAGAAGNGIFGYQRLLVSVTDAGLPTPRARYTWQGVAGQAAPRVIESFDSLGRKTDYYSTNGVLSSARDAAGGWVRQTYDVDGRLIASADALGRTNRQSYFGGGKSASVQSVWGDVTRFKYDNRGNVIEKTQTPKAGCGTDIWWCQTITVKAEYHPVWNKPTKIVQPATIVGLAEGEWLMTYNVKGLLEEQRSPEVFDSRNNQMARATTRFWYDAYGRQERMRDPTGVEAVQVWGGAGGPAFCLRQSIASAQAGGLNLTTQYACNAMGDVTSVTDPRGHTTTTDYDSLRRKWREQGPAGTNIQTQWTYDLDGNVTHVHEWGQGSQAWATTATTYSLTGKPLTVTDPSGDVSRTCYDALDRAVVAVDPTGRATRTSYNAASQPTQVERWFTANVGDAACALTDARPEGINTNIWRQYEYNAAGLQSAEIDANGNRTQMTYEGLGRLISTQFADGADAWTIHDQRGQVVLSKTRGGDFRDAFYDHLGRITHVWENEETAREYLKGRNTRTGYDLAGRPVWKDVSTQPNPQWDESLRRDVHIYGYDAAGRATTDQVQPMDGAIGSAAKILTYGYDAAGNRTSITWPDGFAAAYVYDAANRPQTVNYAGHSATLNHDSRGRRNRIDRSNGVSTVLVYQKDNDLQSLTHTWASGSGQAAASWTYGHDAAGRVTSTDVTRLDLEWLPTTAYAKAYGPANNLNQVTSQAGQALAFNANGNLSTFQGATYTWALGNRLIGVSRPGMSASYAYDGEDRRTMKTVDGVITRTLWSGADEVAEMDAAGNILRRFIPDGSGAMDGRLASLEANGTIYWHHTDHQGSVVATSNASGAPVSLVNYSPNGELGTAADGTTLAGPPTGSPFGYTGRQYDPETGLWQYRARYYHPQLGQFLSHDPIGTKDDPNLYMYVANDPVNNTDPDGEQARRPPTARPPSSMPSISSQLAARQIASWNSAGRQMDSNYRGYQYLGNATPAGASQAREMFGRAQAANADRNGISLAGGQPGAQYQANLLSGPAAGAQQAWSGTINSQSASSSFTAYRVFGGEASQQGAWLSPTAPSSSASARSSLALPSGNTAASCCAVTVPSGTKYQSGTAAGAFGQAGGGQQIQLLERLPASAYGPAYPLK